MKSNQIELFSTFMSVHILRMFTTFIEISLALVTYGQILWSQFTIVAHKLFKIFAAKYQITIIK